MDYRVVGADASIGQIQVTFSDNGVDIATYAVDVPVVDGAFITGELLDAEIRSREPSWLLARKQQVSAATGFESVSQVAAVAAPIPLTIEQHKANKKEAVNAYREVVLAAGVDYNGMRYDSDNVSVARLTTLSSVLIAGAPLPTGFVWRSATNVDVAFTAGDVFGLLGVMISKADEIFKRSWSKKAEVDACNSNEAVDAIGWQESGVPRGAIGPTNPPIPVAIP